MPPFTAWAARIAGRGGKISDNFNRSLTGSLGSTSTGSIPWTIVSGTWNVNGTKPTTSTSQGSNPVAVVNLGVSDVDVKLATGAGDALYFRVQDASNWWRVLYDGYQTSSCDTCCSSCCDTCCNTCQQNYYVCASGHCPQCGGGCGCSCSTYSSSCTNYGALPGCDYSCNCYSCNCYSCNCYSCNCVYYDNYRVLLQKNTAGSVSTVYTSSVIQGSGAAVNTVRAVVKGSSITVYRGVSQIYSGTDSAFSTVSKHGIGRGASNYNSSAIDDFEMSWS